MSEQLTYKNLKQEFRLTDDGDAWGNVMKWWFTIADEIYFNRDSIAVPDEWQFRASPLGPSNEPDEYEPQIVSEASDEALEKFGALMHRYAQRLKAAGRSY